MVFYSVYPFLRCKIIFISSDTESAEQVDGAKEEKDAATVEEGAITNNNTKKSVSAR